MKYTCLRWDYRKDRVKEEVNYETTLMKKRKLFVV